MTASWDWKSNVTINGLTKKESGSVSGMPWPVNINNGALYGGTSDSNTLWSFGGTTSSFNQSFPYFEIPPTQQYAIWAYDLNAETWAAIDTSSNGINIPSYGASAESEELGLAFYVGGQIDSGTSNTTAYLDNNTIPLNGMVVLDTASYNVVNISVPANINGDRTGAGMVYVNTLGKEGVLALVGGETTSDGLLGMDQIAIFDVSTVDMSNPSTSNNKTNAWYLQTATGDIPDPRTDFCLVSAPAQDNSSANIYLYGGRSNGTIFDDVYVLSLPSFTWVRVFLGQDARWSVTCHFIPPRQMITVGGGGKYTNITSDCDWEVKSLAVLDLSTIGWGSVFDANAPNYEVPSAVVAVIGGTYVTSRITWLSYKYQLTFPQGFWRC
jgi:Kelch motif